MIIISFQAGRSTAETNAVITTAVIADLPVLSSMLSRLFESSQHLNDVALHHLIDALCQLSRESMELAYTNREPSLFAVAKLLETGQFVHITLVSIFHYIHLFVYLFVFLFHILDHKKT